MHCDHRGNAGGEGDLTESGTLKSRLNGEKESDMGRLRKQTKQRHRREARRLSVCLEQNEHGVERGQSKIIFAIWNFQAP